MSNGGILRYAIALTSVYVFLPVKKKLARYRGGFRLAVELSPYSHSIVSGGFPVTSQTNREIPLTSFTILDET